MTWWIFGAGNAHFINLSGKALSLPTQIVWQLQNLGAGAFLSSDEASLCWCTNSAKSCSFDLERKVGILLKRKYAQNWQRWILFRDFCSVIFFFSPNFLLASPMSQVFWGHDQKQISFLQKNQSDSKKGIDSSWSWSHHKWTWRQPSSSSLLGTLYHEGNLLFVPKGNDIKVKPGNSKQFDLVLQVHAFQ